MKRFIDRFVIQKSIDLVKFSSVRGKRFLISPRKIKLARREVQYNILCLFAVATCYVLNKLHE